MRNIVVTANTSWYVYNFRRNTLIKLVELGFQVTVIAPEDNYSIKLKALGVDFLPIYIDQAGVNPLKDFFTFISFVRFFSELRPEFVLNFTPKNNIYSTIAAKLFNAKVINNISGLGVAFINSSILSRFVKFMYKFSQSYADFVFFQNNDDRDVFIKNNMITIEKCGRLPGSGVDLCRFQYSEPEDTGVVTFLLTARMLYEKGVGHYFKAAAALKAKYGEKVEFQLLGFLDVNNPSAVSKEEMDSWHHSGVINYLGVSDNVEALIRKADCQVLPSFYREGVPKTLLEAGAIGRPIITTDSVGCRETVDDGINGFICKPRSTDSLVKKLELIINMPYPQRVLMGEKSRAKIVREFDENIVIDMYLDKINQLSE